MKASIARSVLKGGKVGALAGAAGSVLSGAAVVVTAPGWLPFIGGTLLISSAAVATGAAIGGGFGAALGGVSAFLREKQQERRFREEFGDIGR